MVKKSKVVPVHSIMHVRGIDVTAPRIIKTGYTW